MLRIQLRPPRYLNNNDLAKRVFYTFNKEIYINDYVFIKEKKIENFGKYDLPPPPFWNKLSAPNLGRK
jgi:hypothetical protein